MLLSRSRSSPGLLPPLAVRPAASKVMQRGSATLYFVVLATSLSANKFVLSTLGFQYPMVFQVRNGLIYECSLLVQGDFKSLLCYQGWQTLVGFVLYQILHSLGLVKITSLDLSGYISLFPFFLFFTSSILTGSMALSKIPLASFLAISALVPVAANLAADYDHKRKQPGTESKLNRYVTKLIS